MNNEFLLSDRLQKIRQIINQYGEDEFVLSFSGGKDSTVLHYLVDEALPGNNIPRVFFNTGIEFKMTVDFVKKMQENDPRFEIIPPHVNIRQMLEQEGYPFKSKEHSQYLEQYRKNNYEFTPSIYNYANRIGEYNNKYGCLKRLSFQFSPDYHLKISAKCCDRLKKDTAKEYLKSHNKHWSMTGIRKDEGGVRIHSDCVITDNKGGGKFNPLFPLSNEFIDWYIESRKIELCELYYPPYNFERTGCAGCPFNIKLQEELDILEELLPAEKKKCETIWKPVYDEYRLLAYRLERRFKLTPRGRLNELSERRD